MSAILYHLQNADPQERTAAIEHASDVLRHGGLVIFPTETVYGIGCDALNADAVENLYRAKKRPYDMPLLLHLYDREQAERASVLDEKARKLLSAFTPGPFSLIVPKKEIIPPIVTSGGNTVGLRFPSDPLFLELAETFGGILAATSANLSGFSSAKNGEAVAELQEIADVILENGECLFSMESTILSMTGKTPKILRQGALPREEIEKVIGICESSV
ncbi:MAG: threonylcarbamoyl-AMP synthase [Clostridiales bacterium]|nr:threonylcarbamoyl-AMP synthase [Candidatus Coliplasma caballi]